MVVNASRRDIELTTGAGEVIGNEHGIARKIVMIDLSLAVVGEIDLVGVLQILF